MFYKSGGLLPVNSLLPIPAMKKKKPRSISPRMTILCGQQRAMMRDRGTLPTTISTKIWKELGRPKLDEKTSENEKYDNHKMKQFCDFH